MKKIFMTFSLVGFLAMLAQPASAQSYYPNQWVQIDAPRTGVSVARPLATGAACPVCPQQCCPQRKCCPTQVVCPQCQPACPAPCPVETGPALPIIEEEKAPVRGYW